MLAVRETLAGRNILLTGASGFVGKFWLIQILCALPEIGRITLLIRAKGRRSGHQRFEDMVNSVALFKVLHDRYGAELSRLLSEKVEIVEGSVEYENFGITEPQLSRLRRDLDLIVNCAGLVEFNPDPRLALDTNVLGAIRAAELTRSCAKARLLHISTCYVAGRREGEIPERVEIEKSPNGKRLDPMAEVAWIREEIKRIVERYSEGEGGENRRRARELRQLRDLVDLGRNRADYYGWPNTYTYSKSLAERILVTQNSDISFSILRPAIVEASFCDPIAGWNEGMDGAGPLAYALKGWFRRFVAKPGNPFDIVPVDMVGRGMSIACAALLQGCSAQVYHAGSSHLNRLTIDRATELTGLYHRMALRRRGAGFLERTIKARWEAKPIEREPLISVHNMREWSRTLGVELQRPPAWLAQTIKDFSVKVGSELESVSRQLRPLETLIEVYRPFVYDMRQIFRADNLVAKKVEPDFEFAIKKIDWRKYWLEYEMPALEKYCFPVMEGEEPETYTPPTPFRFIDVQAQG